MQSPGSGVGVGGGAVSSSVPQYSNSLGEPFTPERRPDEVPVLASSIIAALTWAGVQEGLSPRKRAATPATWGEAIEVPFQVPVEVSLSLVAEVIDEPGANRSTQLP